MRKKLDESICSNYIYHFFLFQPPGQPGGVGLGMMKQSGSAGTPSGHLVHQLPVHHQPGPGLQGETRHSFQVVSSIQ